MDRLDAMAAFLAAVDRGSLAAASRQLGCSPAAVTRAIAALEDRLDHPSPLCPGEAVGAIAIHAAARPSLIPQ